MKLNPLTPEEASVIIHKGTETSFSGELLNNRSSGLYLCKQCDAVLYYSSDKFEAHCGWPAFDAQIAGAVTRIPDIDGQRTEIICTHCDAHLGHVFEGEQLTEKNTRYCVNSISMRFMPGDLEIAYFASGCFWGTEYYFMKAHGVKQTTVGFMGGTVNKPTYEQVCTKTTGHIETIQVIFNTKETSYEELLKLFFETHDFCQTDGQGPDIGPQYLSAIFYLDQTQREIAQKIINELTEKKYCVRTQLRSATTFWKAEDYHQQYYELKGSTPYCHHYQQIF